MVFSPSPAEGANDPMMTLLVPRIRVRSVSPPDVSTELSSTACETEWQDRPTLLVSSVSSHYGGEKGRNIYFV